MNTLKDLLLAPPPLTLSVAESMTSGQLQAQIGSISGASNFFLGGITAYTIEQKVRILGVSRAVAEPVDCVSEEVAIEMARGVRLLFQSDLSLSTTGYAEPCSVLRAVDERTDVPFIWWALCHGSHVQTGRIEFPGLGRIQVQTQAAAAVLNILEQYLKSVRRS